MMRHRVLVLRVVMALGLVGVLYGGLAVAQQRAAAAMAEAATAFLESLTEDQRATATFALDDEELTRWHFVPTNMFPRNGLPIQAMTPAQRERAHDLLRASLSRAGYETVTNIMSLEEILRDLQGAARGRAAGGLGTGPVLAVAQDPAPAGQGGRRGGGRGGGGGGMIRDPELYYFSIFGTPSASGQWGLRVEGHHLSLHFTVDGSRMAVVNTPSFMGSNPAEVADGPRAGQRVLGPLEDAGRALLESLTEAQRATAVIAAEPPRDIETSTMVEVDPLSPAGLMASEMTPAQRELLMAVIEAFNATQTPDVVAARMAEIEEAGLDAVGFAWAGSIEAGQRYHYRIQGPSFLIEHNKTQNNGNHVHSVWRDFDGDFGRDLLAEHMAMFRH